MRKDWSMGSNTQQKLGKVRPPRVQITYDVETGGVSTSKTLPLVVGVIGDLAPGSAVSQERLGDRQFVKISEDSFDSVLSSFCPTLEYKVRDCTKPEGDVQVALKIKSLEDLSPAGVAMAVPEVAALLETRGKLNDLLAKLEGNDRLNELLSEIVASTELQDKAKSELEKRKAPQPSEKQ